MSKKPNALLEKRVKTAIAACLNRNGKFTYPELFIQLGILQPKLLVEWQKGRVSFLEKVIDCNLTKLTRIMTAVRRATTEFGLSKTVGPQPKQRYSKSGIVILESEYRSIYACKQKAKRTSVVEPAAEAIELTPQIMAMSLGD